MPTAEDTRSRWVNSQCENPEAGTCMMCLKNHKETRWGGDEVREMMAEQQMSGGLGGHSLAGLWFLLQDNKEPLKGLLWRRVSDLTCALKGSLRPLCWKHTWRLMWGSRESRHCSDPGGGLGPGGQLSRFWMFLKAELSRAPGLAGAWEKKNQEWPWSFWKDGDAINGERLYTEI